MPLTLDYQNVRDLAKKLRELTGRDIKHTQILAAIAESVGRRPDAMMHMLKFEAGAGDKPVFAQPDIADWKIAKEAPFSTSPKALALARAADLDVWSVGGDGAAFGRVIHQRELPDGSTAQMALMVTKTDGFRVDGDPGDAAWKANLYYNGPTGVCVTYGTGVDGFTFPEALDLGLGFLAHADADWEELFSQDVERIGRGGGPKP